MSSPPKKRQTGLPLQRIRKALHVLNEQGELPHALASKRLYTEGAQVLYEYASSSGDRVLRLLTVVDSGQRVFHEVISGYLKRITFEDAWATGLILPITADPILRVQPDVASGDPSSTMSSVTPGSEARIAWLMGPMFSASS